MKGSFKANVKCVKHFRNRLYQVTHNDSKYPLLGAQISAFQKAFFLQHPSLKEKHYYYTLLL